MATKQQKEALHEAEKHLGAVRSGTSERPGGPVVGQKYNGLQAGVLWGVRSCVGV